MIADGAGDPPAGKPLDVEDAAGGQCFGRQVEVRTCPQPFLAVDPRACEISGICAGNQRTNGDLGQPSGRR